MNYELHKMHLLLLDMEEQEELKDIPGWEGLYAATRDGRIWSHRRKIFLKQFDNGQGYYSVKLYKDKKALNKRVNVLIAQTYIPIPEKLKDIPLNSLDVAHEDDNRANNHYSNLFWKTRQENLDTDSFREKSKIKIRTRIRCVETGEIFKDMADAARWAGTSRHNIGNVIHGYQKTAGGYHWERYYEV